MINQHDLSDEAKIGQLRELCRKRIDFFAYAVLGYKITPFHSKMLTHQLKTPHSMVLAPRGGGKSTICDIAYVLWRLIQVDDPRAENGLGANLRICIASKSEGQAVTFLSEIKQHITENKTFIAIFGDLKGNKWNDNEINLATRTKIMKEPNIVALGAGGGIVGRHFDIIIGDDLVDLDNSRTDVQRLKVKEWYYNVLLPTLEPDTGELRIIGTRYHPEDLYGHFAYRDKKTGDYRDEQLGGYVFVVPSLTVHRTTDANGNVVETETSFWAEKFPVAFLQARRRSMGLAWFALQFQNDPSIVSEGIIKLTDLEPYVWVDEDNLDGHGLTVQDLTVYQGVDPAISQKQTADFFVHFTIGINFATGDVYELDMVEGRFTFLQQIEIIRTKAQEWGPVAIGIESVAYQAALAQAFANDFWMPVVQIKTKLDKIMRTKLFSALTEQHKLHLRHTSTRTMEILVNMPNVQHDDRFDGLDMACTAAKQTMIEENVVGFLSTNFMRR